MPPVPAAHFWPRASRDIEIIPFSCLSVTKSVKQSSNGSEGL